MPNLLIKKRINFLLWGVSLSFLNFDTAFAKQTLPKWEIGVGPGLLSYADYPGSKEQNNLILPFPYITYRGKDFEIDQREVKKPMYEMGRTELDLSLSGTVPVSSKDNQARKGMDNLDASLGLGPVVRYQLYHHDLNQFKFEWPVRWVIATDFRSLHEEGFISKPGFYYYFRKSYTPRQRIKITLGTTANFATAKTNNYFYGVKASEATSTRSAYRATGGFTGFGYVARVNWHLNDFWLGAFYRFTDLSQSVFHDSPLIETTKAETFGFAVTWNFFTSKETVEALE